MKEEDIELKRVEREYKLVALGLWLLFILLLIICGVSLLNAQITLTGHITMSNGINFNGTFSGSMYLMVGR